MNATGRATAEALIAQNCGVVLMSELLGAGVSDDVVGRAVRRGWLRRLSRAAYTTQSLWDLGDPWQQHFLKILARQRRNLAQVAMGLSAAALLRLPLPSGPPEHPQLLMPRGKEHLGATGHRGGAVQRRAWLNDDEVETREGLRLTTPARTVIDCARHLDGPWALAVGDAAAGQYDLTRADVMRLLAAASPSPGHRRARWVAMNMDPRAESPLESLARGIVLLAGLPGPEPQPWIRTEAGSFRVDLLDRVNNVVIEADGRLKYQNTGDLWSEKEREDWIRETGVEVCRFTMRNYYDQEQWLQRYRRALTRGRARRHPGGPGAVQFTVRR